MHQQSKLHWQCRRGMLELDLLLKDYLDKHYPCANEQEQAKFLSLLELEDTELLAELQALISERR
ncbi:succinate dehydrogenase assembly factor 2 [Methylocucumis oryzae]|uniref:succinate dehydrogenase assembly factor 2 n=1 Tax=Methylocucumis oryzae TaxID=1632867 RepID=UPI001EF9D10A|nr:succinate dehydrogenase assembly factor 2 [Methylocucumis oryzae]